MLAIKYLLSSVLKIPSLKELHSSTKRKCTSLFASFTRIEGLMHSVFFTRMRFRILLCYPHKIIILYRMTTKTMLVHVTEAIHEEVGPDSVDVICHRFFQNPPLQRLLTKILSFKGLLLATQCRHRSRWMRVIRGPKRRCFSVFCVSYSPCRMVNVDYIHIVFRHYFLQDDGSEKYL